jgi:hypothetical protein
MEAGFPMMILEPGHLADKPATEETPGINDARNKKRHPGTGMPFRKDA